MAKAAVHVAPPGVAQWLGLLVERLSGVGTRDLWTLTGCDVTGSLTSATDGSADNETVEAIRSMQ